MRLCLVCALLATALSCESVALAQPEPGDVGIFFDATGTQTRLSTIPYVAFDMYLVVFDLPIDFRAVTFGLEFVENIAITSYDYTPLSDGAEWYFQPNGWWVFGDLCFPADETVWLVHFTAMLLAPQTDLTICVGPCVAGNEGLIYLEHSSCGPTRDWTRHPLFLAQYGQGVYPDGCAVINPTDPEAPIAKSASSWSSLKANYQARQ